MACDVYLNGVLIGKHENPYELVEKLREERRAGRITYDVSISYEEENNEVQIYTVAGRILRPSIVVKNLKKAKENGIIEKFKNKEITIKDFVKEGIVEYIDAGEEENIYVAFDEEKLNEDDYTHLELTPSLLTSISEGTIPFPQYNSAPRVEMGAAMAKQAVGIYSLAFPERLDSISNLLIYPQVPICKTDIYKVLNFEERPSGQNLVVAILSYEGYNMEDAVILNQSSVERGLGRSIFYRTYTAEKMSYRGMTSDKFEIPDENVEGRLSEEKYRHLDEDGIIFPEVLVNGGDVLVGKTAPPRFLTEISAFGRIEERRREASVTVRKEEKGIVDAVVLTLGSENNETVKVRVRELRIPEIGDKFASRYGQKGVVGMLYKQEDMPFTKDGIVPDLIMNPHAIPSRTTVGHLLDMLAGTAGCLSGRFIDGTAFENEKEEDIRKILKEYGLKSNGKQTFYNPKNGEKMELEIFTGIIYYQRLHHMVANKIHTRSRGPVQLLTKQPTAGKAKLGGLRFGEMERDCLIGYGAAYMLKDRLLNESDKIRIPVCSKCGLVAIRNYDTKQTYCKVCGEVPVYDVEISYGFKLLMDEMLGMGIVVRFKLDDIVK
ncbi:MAG: DNA-directed RNA polymerase subunit B [Candidatus Altarchaeaceae archaeon]